MLWLGASVCKQLHGKMLKHVSSICLRETFLLKKIKCLTNTKTSLSSCKARINQMLFIVKYVLSTIRFYFNKDWGCVIFREINFLLNICWSIRCLHPSWKVHTWIEICASLNHRKKTKADGSRLTPRNHIETLVLLSVIVK